MTHGSTMFNPFFVVVLNQFDQTNDTTMALANSSAMGTSRALQAPPRYAPKRCPQQLSPQQNGEFSQSLQITCVWPKYCNSGTKWGTIWSTTIRITQIKYINLPCANMICFVIGSRIKYSY